jgi:hypothetical protein
VAVNRDLNQCLLEIRQRWRDQGLGEPAGTSPAEVAALEAQLRTRLPAAFRRYLRELGGTPGDAYDSNMIHFWTYGHFLEYGSELDSPEYGRLLPFGDVFIEAYRLAIGLQDSTQPGAVYGLFNEYAFIMSNSFDEFLSKYLDDPESIESL